MNDKEIFGMLGTVIGGALAFGILFWSLFFMAKGFQALIGLL